MTSSGTVDWAETEFDTMAFSMASQGAMDLMDRYFIVLSSEKINIKFLT